MHDIKWIRENPEAFDAGLARRGLSPLSAELIALDAKKREAQTELQILQAQRNDVAKQIGVAMREDKAKAEALKEEAARIKARLAELEAAQSDDAHDELREALSRIPNIPAAEVPEGADEHGNVVLRTFGEPVVIDGAREHFDLGEALGLMDFETAAKISGARFVITRGALARLERALGNFMLDMHTQEFGYTETNPPVLVKAPALYGTGNLPKFADDLFIATTSEIQTSAFNDALDKFDRGEVDKETPFDVIVGSVLDRRYLIPTAEVSLTNVVADTILPTLDSPMRLTALTPCFRAEAGSAGRDTRGMIRQHQFSKVELVSITRPEDSEAEHERMVGCAEEVLKRLKLPFRTMLLCTGDMGFCSRKTYDIEVWLPGQGKYREISSCSNCGDFQARRMNARYRVDEKNVRHVHTLNGSGLAVGRTLVAVLENYQQPDGSIRIPDVLVPYMAGQTVIQKA